MLDKEKREIKYARISITDKCNLRCKYCMPDGEINYFESEKVMTQDQIVEIVKKLALLGIDKIKITGGEPLLREDVCQVVKRLKSIRGIKTVSLTTNGVLLNKYLKELERAGLDAITISIDTLKDSVNIEITKRDVLSKVIKNIDLTTRSSIKNIKLNVVPLRELGESNIVELINFANEKGIIIRFIEMMPIGLGKKYRSYNYYEILEILEKNWGISNEVDLNIGNGPASYYQFEGLDIKVGIIAALSNKFCESCNRVRVTSDGHLKQCLNYNYNIDLNEITDDKLIEEFILNKPKEHAFGEGKQDIDKKMMHKIGG